MLYHFYEWNHAALTPFRAVADLTKLIYQNPLNPIAHTEAGRAIAAMAELFERTTRVYGKPAFGLDETVVRGMRVPVAEKVVLEKTFCRLLHFDRALPEGRPRGPRFLIVAPMSGHYATLLRGTVEALLPYGEVHITDWIDARMVPLAAGRFDLDDYVDYLIDMLHFLGPDTHVIGVCQPAVPVLIASAVMEARADPDAPSTLTLMGGPIDTRVNPTAVNRLAMERGIDWFRDNVIMQVPFPNPGFMREVYPGFLQLSGFMSMNLDRHLIAHKDFFMHLVKNDGDGATKHREFYDEYNAVMDLTAEFYLQTVEQVFITHALPKGEMTHRGERVDLKKIRRAALLTVEGENDDISGVGQTEAAQHLCTSIPADRRVHYVQPKVGHYGVFNGSRFRAEIAPRIVDFALTHGDAGIAARKAEEAAQAAASGAQAPAPQAEEEAKAAAPQAPEAFADASAPVEAAPVAEGFQAASDPAAGLAEAPAQASPEARAAADVAALESVGEPAIVAADEAALSASVSDGAVGAAIGETPTPEIHAPAVIEQPRAARPRSASAPRAARPQTRRKPRG